MRKGFAPVIALVVVAVIAIIGLALFKKSANFQSQVQPQSEKTVDQYPGEKTYKNTSYGFNLRYPKSWFIKEYQDSAANFYDTNPQEATSGAIKVRYASLNEKVDIAEFETIQKLDIGREIREPLDVKSIITKISNLEIAQNSAIEYEINRNFSALEGPKTEYSHVYEIKKGDTILKFIASEKTKEHEQQIEPTFARMIKSLKF